MKRLVLATAAYNEERYIENLIQSVVAQTHRPARWVIVSDGSTDRTDEIVNDYAARHNFIHLRRITENRQRTWMNQVQAINLAFQDLWPVAFDFIGNLDADITLEAEYFATLLARFDQDPNLGLAGGYIYERTKGQFQPRKGNNPMSVAHAVQLFRRACLEQLGRRYFPMPYGAPDSHAEVNARLHGWKVQAFTDLPAYHHRLSGTADGALRIWYKHGLQDYSLGSHWSFEVFRVARRLRQRPYILGPMARLWAFIAASVRREKRPVSAEFVQFRRNYEMERLKRLFVRGPE